jgi:lysyl-tRNA synthetase class I
MLITPTGLRTGPLVWGQQKSAATAARQHNLEFMYERTQTAIRYCVRVNPRTVMFIRKNSDTANTATRDRRLNSLRSCS